VRAHFGPVTSASVVGAHNEHINTGDSADTGSFFVAELLLHSERGPAVIELEFDNHALGSERVSGASNSNPATPPISLHRTASGSRPPTRRDGRPADQIALSEADAPPQPTTPPPAEKSPLPASRSPRQGRAEMQLRCVQRADGDLAKLQQCARS
jgi:hypothetical protein